MNDNWDVACALKQQIDLSPTGCAPKGRQTVRVAEYLAECKLAANQVLAKVNEPEGWFRLQASLPDTPQLRWWLLCQGDDVKDV